MAIFRVPINLTWSGSGSPGVNVFHVRDDAWPGSTNLDTTISALRDAYADLCNSTTGILALGTKVSLGDIVELESGEYVQPGAGAWTDQTSARTGGNAAPALQIVVSWRTTLAARRGMGRTFLGPLAAPCVDADGTPTTAAMTAAKAFGQDVLNQNGTVGSSRIGIYGAQAALTDAQKQSGDYPRVLRDITGYRVRDQFAVLRSRRD